MVTGEMGTNDAPGVVPAARRARSASPGTNGHDDVRLVAERATSDSVGARLRARREAHGISLRQFARQLDVSASFISQLETGKAKPSVATLYSICAALEMSIDELFAVEPPVAHDVASVPVGTEQGVSTSAALRDTLLRGWGGSPGEDRVRSPLVSPEERRALVLDSGVTWQRLTATNHTHSDFMFVRYDVGGSSTSDGRLVRHAGIEYGFVISGTLEVTLGFETYRMNAGDSISFDSEVPHRLCNVGDVPVEAIWFDQHYAHGAE